MPVPTEKIVESYKLTGSYQRTAQDLGMEYDAVRKRLKRLDPYPIVPGKSVNYDADGVVKSVWATGKRMGGVSAEDVAEAVNDALRGFKPPKARKPTFKGEKGLLGLWSLADLHMGMRAWGKETGGPDWDIKIAEKAYQEGLREVTDRTPKVEKAIVLSIGDLAHADNFHQTTTNPGTHHVVDVDGRYPMQYRAAVDMVLFTVEMALTRAETVEVVLLPGNHDGALTVGARIAIELNYKDHKNVTVCTSPNPFWWSTWGKCMFGATHGDKATTVKLPGLMAATKPVMWGATKHRFAFTGHLHRKEVKEFPGVTVEVLPCPAPPDSYASGMGFLSSRAFEVKVFHKDKGLFLTPNHTL